MYRTPDLYLASYLKATGIDIVEIDRKRRKVFFVFKESEELTQRCLDFLNDGMVSVNRYKNALQDLKTEIFNGGRYGNQ